MNVLRLCRVESCGATEEEGNMDNVRQAKSRYGRLHMSKVRHRRSNRNVDKQLKCASARVPSRSLTRDMVLWTRSALAAACNRTTAR